MLNLKMAQSNNIKLDVILIVRQIQETFIVTDMRLYYAFIYLEKAFDRVTREVVKWALRKAGMGEWLVETVMGTV